MSGGIKSIEKFLNERVWLGSVFSPMQLSRGRLSIHHCSSLLPGEVFVQLFLLVHICQCILTHTATTSYTALILVHYACTHIHM